MSFLNNLKIVLKVALIVTVMGIAMVAVAAFGIRELSATVDGFSELTAMQSAAKMNPPAGRIPLSSRQPTAARTRLRGLESVKRVVPLGQRCIACSRRILYNCTVAEPEYKVCIPE